jgi:hypothetical protein
VPAWEVLQRFMAQPFESTFLLFADILGFAALVEKEGGELNELSPIFTEVELYSPSPAESLLGYRFIHFHQCINEARRHLQKLGAGTAIVFSDSAFFRIETLSDAVQVARSLMFNLVTVGVPVRMGLAQGTYRMLRFLADSSARVSFHMSQFLGTGVVRAYQAEHCGISGLRILIHPNLEPLLDDGEMRIIPVIASTKQSLDVRWEVNYLEATPSESGLNFDDCIQFDSLRSMIGESEERFQYHYVDTFHAWNRMRAQLGRAPYPWEKFLDRDEYDYSHGIRQRPTTSA